MERKTMPRVIALLLAFVVTCTSVFVVPTHVGAATNEKVSVLTDTDAAAAKKITLTATKKTLYVGKSFNLKVKSVSPKKASKAVTYESNDPDVATVNSKGKVKAKAIGTATITVTSKTNENVTATCKITVKQGVDRIHTAATLVMQKGKSVTLKNGVTPYNASNKKMTYSSSKKSVATVSKSGKITAKKVGTAKITVKAKAGSAKKTVTVKVKNKVKAATKVTVNKTSLVLSQGASEKLKAKTTPSKATYKKVYWISSNTSVATVSSKGTVKAVGGGTAKITAYAADHSGKKAVCTVTVDAPVPVTTVAVTGVTVEPKSLSLAVGASSAPLKATVTPVDATNQTVLWSSSNPAIATVSESGVVTGVADGKAAIVVSTADGGYTAACEVVVGTGGNVAPPVETIPVTGITLNRTELTELVEGGSAFQLEATITPANATNQAVVWSSSDPTIATVENGLVTPLKAGRATIAVLALDGLHKAQCVVTVQKQYVPVEKVELGPDKLTLLQGETATLLPVVRPANATNTECTWSSDKPDVVTVTNGTLEAKAAGTATITVTSVDNPNCSATCVITVSERPGVPVTGVTLTKELTLKTTDEPYQLTAALAPDTATDKTVVWRTSNADVVEIEYNENDGFCILTPKKAGTANVFAQAHNGQMAVCAVTVTQPLESITLADASFVVGARERITAQLNPADALIEGEPNWTCNNDVLEIEQDSKITSPDGQISVVVVAKKAGTASLSVRIGEVSKTCSVKVDPITVTGISIMPRNVSVPKGGTQDLETRLAPTGAVYGQDVTWESSNSEVTVTPMGDQNRNARISVSADASEATLQNGADITATIGGIASEKCHITVTRDGYLEVTKLELKPSPEAEEPLLAGGARVKITAEIEPQDAQITWYSGDEAIADVEVDANDSKTAWIIPGTKTGDVRIYASAGGKLASHVVTVYKAVAEDGVQFTFSIEGETERDYLIVGEKHGELTATITPADAVSKVEWKPMTPELATVVSDGNVNAEGNTTATIHAVGAGMAKVQLVITQGNGQTITKEYQVETRNPFKKLESIQFIRTSLTMYEGNENPVRIHFNPADATNQNVTWTVEYADSADEGCIELIDEETAYQKTVKALKPGKVTLKVVAEEKSEAGEDLIAELPIEVKKSPSQVTSITLNETEKQLFLEGEDTSFTLIPTLTPANPDDATVYWISYDEEVATVAADGTVTAVGEGTTTILAVTRDNACMATCKVTVSKRRVDVTSITLSYQDQVLAENEKITLDINTSAQITGTVQPSDATNQVLAWESSDPEIVSVDPETGVITAKKVGIVTITAKATDESGVTATCQVEVTIPVTNITIDQETLEIKLNEENATLTATVGPEDATDQTIVWKSDNTEVATVDPDTGVVVPMKEGTANITAETPDGKVVSAPCAVTVVEYQNALKITPDKYIFTLDKAASEYLITRRSTGDNFSVTHEEIEHDYGWLVGQFQSGVYDQDFLKNYWDKFDWNTLKNNSWILTNLLFSLSVDGEEIDAKVDGNRILVTVKKGGKTKTITITRIDKPNGGSDLRITDGSQSILVTNINITKQDDVVTITMSADIGKGMDFKVVVSEDSFKLYRVMKSGKENPVIEATITDEAYICEINQIYYEEIMDQLGYVIDIESIIVNNHYMKN